MSLYAHTSVKLDLLKEWSRNLDVEEVIRRSGLGLYGKYSDEKMCRGLLNAFQRCVEDLKEGDDWRNTTHILNKALMPALFKVSDNAIKVANYYEILIEASDVATKKKLIKGYDYLDVGYLHIKNGNQCIATIGEKSDLMWAVLFELFIKEGLYSINHTLPQHESIMALQLYDVCGKTDEEIRMVVDEIIFKCSAELGMQFKIVHLDEKITEEGISGYYELLTQIGEYEHIPMMYFNNAFASNDIRMQYLSYYHVLEYFYVRAQNYELIDKLNAGFVLSYPIRHNDLRKVLNSYKNSTTEKESLKLVLKRTINIDDFKVWVKEVPERLSRITTSGVPEIDVCLTATDEKIVSKLANRIYFFRCSIAHAKGDIDEFVALPEVSSEEIKQELPIVRWVAECTIKCSSIH